MLKTNKKLLFFSSLLIFIFGIIIFSNNSYSANVSLYRSFTRNYSPNNTSTILDAPPQGMALAGNKVVFAQTGNYHRLSSVDYDNTNSSISKIIQSNALGHCNDIAYDPDDGILAVSTVKEDGVTKFWAAHYNPENNNIEDASITEFTDGINSFSGVAYNTDGKYFIGYAGNGSDSNIGTFYRFTLTRNSSTKKIEVSNRSALFTIDKSMTNGGLLTTQGIAYLGNRVFMIFSDLNKINGHYNGNNYIRMYTIDKSDDLDTPRRHIGSQISISGDDIGNPYSSSNSDYLSELESCDFDSNGVMLMLFNTHEGTGSTMKLKFYKTSDHKTKYDIPKSLSVSSLPNKTTYVKNSENLNLAGGKIKLNYYSGSGDAKFEEVDMTNSAVKVTGFSNSSTGTKTLTVQYEGKTATFNVNIIEKSVTSISIASRPTKTTYIQNTESLDLSGGSIKVNYNDNSYQSVNMTDSRVSVTGFNNTSIGTKTLNVAFGGKTTTFNVNIIEKSVTSISIASRPTKTTYIQNTESLDLSGGSIKVNYNDNSYQSVNMTDSRVSVTGFNNTSIGTKTLNVAFGGKTTTFNITIIPPSEEYQLGDVTADGRINIRDIIKIRKYIANSTKWDLTNEQKIRANVDRNNAINIRDIIKIRKYIAASSSETIRTKHPDWLEF